MSFGRWALAIIGFDPEKVAFYNDETEVTAHYGDRGLGMAMAGSNISWPERGIDRARRVGLVWFSFWGPS